MNKDLTLYNQDNHRYVLLNSSDPGEENGISSNQYLIIHKDSGVLLDPGGFGVMPDVLSTVLKYLRPDQIKAIFLSHQDPDIVGGLTSWLELTDAVIYAPKIWLRFLPHYGISGMDRFVGLEDYGERVSISEGFDLDIVPANFLHSPGQINVYDPLSKILFSGDVGAAEASDGEKTLIEDFPQHLKSIAWFHKRYMASNRALRFWVQQVRKREVEIIAPQHGPLYHHDTIPPLLDWLWDLPCGSDLMELEND